MLYSELDDQRWELRRVEIFRDERIIAWGDQKLRTHARQLICRDKHQVGHAIPLSSVNRTHVVAQRLGMQTHFKMLP